MIKKSKKFSVISMIGVISWGKTRFELEVSFHFFFLELFELLSAESLFVMNWLSDAEVSSWG